MDELKKEEIFLTLNRITKVINENNLIQKLSNLVDIKTSVVGGAIRDLYLDKPIKDIDIAISLDFMKELKVNYPKDNYYYNGEYDDTREYWDRASAEADSLKTRQSEILEELKKPEYSIVHEILDKKDLSAIDAVIFLIRKIIENNNDYSITQVFDKTTVEMLADNPKLDEIPYANIGLCAVVAIKDKNTDYPVELLFTTDAPPSFIQCFDFNICKIYMENINDEPIIKTSRDFLKDCEDKTITYTPPLGVDERKVNKSLLVRYDRLHKKFPDFNLVSKIGDVTDDIKTLIQRTIDAINLSIELNPNENKKQNKKTNKI